uniref:Uncharacterized protein n=1 Tax=Aegilops tauschii TaxID=37682 RepID=R7W308_AEGTA
MDDADIDFTNPETYPRPAMDSYFDDVLKDTQHACCNPHVEDLAHHAHTCVHVHTKIHPAESDDVAETSESPQQNSGAKKRPSGNRAAVRRYRDKRKARTALLEEEVARLKALNRQLVRKIQSHSALQAEASRLRYLLVDIRGRIEGELGVFPCQRPMRNNDSADQGSFLGGGAQQATTMDDDGVMSGELLGQAAGDIANNQWLPGCFIMGRYERLSLVCGSDSQVGNSMPLVITNDGI